MMYKCQWRFQNAIYKFYSLCTDWICNSDWYIDTYIYCKESSVKDDMIFLDDGFWTEFIDQRIIAITGALGMGKSLIALDIAESLLKEGYALITNMSCIWADNPDNIGFGKKFVAILDEGGTYVRTGQSVNRLSRFLRKLDGYLILPCKKKPHEDLCDLKLFPRFNFYRHLGIPLKMWRWEVNNEGQKYGGHLLQTAWQSIYGVYSSIDPGDFPEEIEKFIDKQTRELFRVYKRTYKLSDLAVKFESAGAAESVETARDIQAGADKIGRELSILERKTAQNRRR